jgi:hypothetical protein
MEVPWTEIAGSENSVATYKKFSGCQAAQVSSPQATASIHNLVTLSIDRETSALDP